MSPLRGIGLVAMREIKERGRSKPYLVTSLITALVVIGLIVVPTLFGVETETYMVGSIGEGNLEIIETAETLANIDDDPNSLSSVEFEVDRFASIEEAEAALLEGDIVAALVDGSEIIVEREEGFFGSSGPTGLLQQAAGAIALERIVADNGESAAEVIEILSSEPLDVTALVQSEEQSEESSIVAYFGLLLLYMAIILYGSWILTGVTEEKSNRVVEVLISAIRPWQLLAGKIAGIGALAIAQFTGTILLALVAIQVVGSVDIPEIPLISLANLALWFILGFLLYAVLFGAAGSLVGRVEDAQSAAMPMTIFSVIGFFAGFAVLNDPDGTIATVTTLFPFTAPFVVPIRVSLEAIPLWQFLAAIVIVVVTIYIAVRVAGRIYAGGILKSGKRTKLREAWRSAEA